MALYQRRANLWIGIAVLFVAGLLILLSTFMAWTSTMNGWNFANQRTVVTASGQANAAYYYQSPGHLIFTGLWTLIIGALLMLIALLMLVSEGTALTGLAYFLGLVGLVFSVYNIVTIVQLGFGLSGGAIVFLIFSVLGLVGTAFVANAPLMVEETGYMPAPRQPAGRPVRSRFVYRGNMEPTAARHVFWRRRQYIEKR